MRMTIYRRLHFGQASCVSWMLVYIETPWSHPLDLVLVQFLIELQLSVPKLMNTFEPIFSIDPSIIGKQCRDWYCIVGGGGGSHQTRTHLIFNITGNKKILFIMALSYILFWYPISLLYHDRLSFSLIIITISSNEVSSSVSIFL